MGWTSRGWIGLGVILACSGPPPATPEEEPVQGADRPAQVASVEVGAPEPNRSDVAETGSEEPAEPVDDLPEGPEPPAGTLEQAMYWGLEAREYATPMRAPSDAIECAPFEGTGEPGVEWYEQCQIHDTIARTDRGWLVLQVDRDDGGIHALHLFEGNARRKRERVAGEPTPRNVEALRRWMSRPALQPVADRIGRAAQLEFSLGSYHPLVELEGSGWLLWAQTVHDLDDPEWVLWLVSPDGETRHELARRPAELGACDGGGHWCESTDSECDDVGLRAEGRLCVLPLGLYRVAIHERELALLGSVNEAGHGLMGGLTWIAPLPEAFASAPSE
ncbi:MAG: hypothetical protein JJ863_15770 [Deltaproteobacteria bacterium]|nr:hypothetical protein [Deltaproteobacteria bacterium]